MTANYQRAMNPERILAYLLRTTSRRAFPGIARLHPSPGPQSLPPQQPKRGPHATSPRSAGAGTPGPNASPPPQAGRTRGAVSPLTAPPLSARPPLAPTTPPPRRRCLWLSGRPGSTSGGRSPLGRVPSSRRTLSPPKRTLPAGGGRARPRGPPLGPSGSWVR